jgi:predicted PurR-regulated permease PerM
MCSDPCNASTIEPPCRWRAAVRRPASATGVIAVVAALAALRAGADFFVPVVMAVTLAVLLWPAMRLVQRAVRWRALAALLVLGAAAAATALILVAVAGQISETGNRVPDVLRLAARDVASLGGDSALKWRRTRAALEELDRSVARATGTARAAESARTAPKPSLVALALDWTAAGLVGLTKATFGALLKTSAFLLLAFFLLCSGDRLALRVSAWCDDRPRGRGRFAPLVSDLAREMRRFGAVTLLTNTAIGLAVALGFAAFGVTDPWTWGLVAGALHFVPYAGLAVLTGLAAIEVYTLHQSLAAALLAVTYVACVGLLLGSVLAAWLQGRASNVDSALMFAGTIFFGVLWGGWGLVLGPLLVVGVRVAFRHARPDRAVGPHARTPRPALRGHTMAQVA